MDNEYTKREIDLIVKGVTDHINSSDGNQNEKLDKILDQTTKTNGRVTKLEGWRAWLVGTTTLVPILMTLLTYVYFTQIESLQEDNHYLEKEILNNREVIQELLSNI